MRENDKIWWNGELVPWDDAKIHVTSETALRGLNVFEGLRAYWRKDQRCYAIVGLDQHLTRFEQSARLMRIPVVGLSARIKSGIVDLLKSIEQPSDLYLRPTLYVDEGGYELDETKIVTGEFINWKRDIPQIKRQLNCGISNWHHVSENTLPTSAKIGATYTAFRLARLDVMTKGLDECILLNQDGFITETPGGSILLVNGNSIITPPIDAGILPSVTRSIVLNDLCPSLGLEVKIRNIHAEEIFSTEAIMIVGTLDEISEVARVDEYQLPTFPNENISAVAELFRRKCNMGTPEEVNWISLFKGEA